MSQESNYTRRSSFSSSSNNKPPLSQDERASKRYFFSRHYASPEESDAVLPVFTTPTHMYIQQELNPQQRYSPVQQQYSPSQQQQNYTKPPGFPLAQQASSTNQYGRTRGESSPSRPAMDHFDVDFEPSNYHTSSIPDGASTSDMLLAHLVDMGFTLEASRVAMAASGGTNLQQVLDILVQDAKAERQMPRSTAPPPPSRPNYQTPPLPPSNNYQTPPPPSSSNYPSSAPPSPLDDEDEEREKEAVFKKQQEERRKDYLDQLKREKPIPPTPSPRPDAAAYADKERKQGNYLFNKSQFVEAEAAYSLAIAALPSGHGDLVLLSNNRAATRLKQGKYQDCLSDCAIAIDIARKQMATSTDVTWKQQIMKALHRKACALEGLGLFEAAIQVYEEYVRMDGSRSAQVQQGITRCQQQQQKPCPPPRPSWQPAVTNATTAFPDIDFNMFIPKNDNLEKINKSKAVQEMRDREKKKEAEDAERLNKEDKVNAQISGWKLGKDKNLRGLLSSLDLILWPGVAWKGVMMTDLLEPRKCKLTYMKAIAKVHPDKLPSNATVEQKMLASGIFTTLNQAWDVFKLENHL